MSKKAEQSRKAFQSLKELLAFSNFKKMLELLEKE